jgi:hypothetical protein
VTAEGTADVQYRRAIERKNLMREPEVSTEPAHAG